MHEQGQLPHRLALPSCSPSSRPIGGSRRSRRVGRSHHSVTPSGEVDAADVSAQLHDGVLPVRVPKSVQAEPRRIAVSGWSPTRVRAGGPGGSTGAPWGAHGPR